MPVEIINVKGTITGLATCDYCRVPYGTLDRAYLEYSGYLAERPKFPIKCGECSRHEFLCGFFPGCIIPGYGRVSIDTINSVISEQKGFTMSTESKVRIPKVGPDQINWDAIDKMITDRSCRISVLSGAVPMVDGTSGPVNAQDLRIMFENHYGTKVEYKRGKTGGVFWADTRLA